jgi:hypothetical protein
MATEAGFSIPHPCVERQFERTRCAAPHSPHATGTHRFTPGRSGSRRIHTRILCPRPQPGPCSLQSETDPPEAFACRFARSDAWASGRAASQRLRRGTGGALGESRIARIGNAAPPCASRVPSLRLTRGPGSRRGASGVLARGGYDGCRRWLAQGRARSCRHCLRSRSDAGERVP